MSNTKDDTSDIKQAAEQVDTQEIEKNLESEENNSVDSPEDLTKEQQVPFIDESVRTDK